MGSNEHYAEEAPAHPVTVDGFWIDRAPVTNRVRTRSGPAANQNSTESAERSRAT